MNPEKHDHHGHRSRLRERYIKEGSDSFKNHELLELLLYYCYPRCNTNDIAHRMLKAYESQLHKLLDDDVPTLMSKLNCSENVAVMLSLIPAFSKRYRQSKQEKKITLDNSKTAGEYAVDLFVGHTNERFYLISLDAGNRVNNTALISDGTLDESAIYPRKVLAAAIQDKAFSVILVHNHPGGTLKPSRGDLEVTRHIAEGLEFIHVSVIDHIIVAGEKYYSFADRKQHVAGY